MENNEKKLISDEALEQVTGGQNKIDPDEYEYETTTNKVTNFLTDVPSPVTSAETIQKLYANTEVRVRDRKYYYDYQQRPYLKCIVRLKSVVEGYIMADDLNPEQ